MIFNFWKPSVERDLIRSALANHSASFTPDLIRLENREQHLLFLYDEHQEKLKRHTFSHKDVCGCGSALSDLPYTMWKRKLGDNTFPIALNTEYHGIKKALIKGELFLTNPRALIYMDKLRQNGVQFERVRTRILYQYQQPIFVDDRDMLSSLLKINIQKAGRINIPAIQPLKAWMYVGKKEYWDDKLDSGYEYAPVKCYKPNNLDLNSPYYYFTNAEYK